eukprot:gb/GECG01014616.1/.p1 GENE.gb/GECG01014616.1/~~gb/GECG01014616.1/.p1  ORF type:complete len:171 (+),score=30.17 gb/GECG01014616.1/:1-513(+)
MPSFGQYMRGNPHFAQAVWMMAIGVLPATVYMMVIAPSDQEKRKRNIERDPDPEHSRKRAKEFGALLKSKENKDMDPIYHDLIRGGASSKPRRKQAVYGKLGSLETDQRDIELAKSLGIDVSEEKYQTMRDQQDGPQQMEDKNSRTPQDKSTTTTPNNASQRKRQPREQG